MGKFVMPNIKEKIGNTINDISQKIEVTNELEEQIKGVVMNVPIEQIELNSKNDYEIINIDELAESISKVGLIHNIVVNKIESDKYRLISGERRLKAFQMLKLPTITAKIIEVDENMENLILDIANAHTRELSPSIRAKVAKRIFDNIQHLREEGYNFETKTRDIVAQKIGVNKDTVQKLISVDRLIPELKTLFNKEIIPLETANQYAMMPPITQKLVFDMYENGKSFTAKEAKELKYKLKESEDNSKEVIKNLRNDLNNLSNEYKVNKDKYTQTIKEKDGKIKDYDNKLLQVKNELTQAKQEIEKEQLKAEQQRDDIEKKLEIEKAKEQANNPKIKELEDKLNEENNNLIKIKREYDDKIKELSESVKTAEIETSKVIDEYEERLKDFKDKEINQQNTILNMELLALSTNINSLLTTFTEKLANCKQLEAFSINDEVKKNIEKMFLFKSNM